MALNDDKDIIKLVIEAENLATDELIDITQDIRQMGDEAALVGKDLDKLKVDRDVIDSYKETAVETKRLRDELSKAEISYINLKKEVKGNKQATDEQRVAVTRANIELKAQRVELRSQESAYAKLSTQAKKLGIDSNNVAEVQERVADEIKRTTGVMKTLNVEYGKNVKELKKKTTAEKEARTALKAKVDAVEKAAKAAKDEAVAIEKEVKAIIKLELEQERVIKSVKKYEIALVKLNAERDQGKISAGQAIRREKQLREQYKLTEKQVVTSRAAIKADQGVKKNAAKNTDLLTQATRRLAQAYTVLIVAQKATQAIKTSVQNYGDLEQAIVKVEKTTGEAKDKLLALTEQIVTLSTDVTPTATNELLKMAEVAGQLGVTGTESLLKMVRAADALEVSTNLSGEAAATLLTRILGMTGEGIPEIDALASVVVGLGNNFAVAEDEILQMTKEVVNGTQSIKLGSAAAAAYGTVLKEMGQTGERSRSSLFKLSQAIKSASADGGDDLIRLMKYTQQTADEIEKNLGERPEKVLTDLINGFAGAVDSGENLNDILNGMGINGIEAVSTIEALVNGNERLNDALSQSATLFEEQNAHFLEAAKQYGTQNAAIDRLINKFTDLTVKVGEAYSDETDTAIRTASELIEQNSEAVVELTNLMGQLGGALTETFDIFGNLGSVFVGAETDISLLDFAIMSVRETFNLLSIAINTMILGLQGFVLAAAKAIDFFNDNAISDEWFTDFEKGMRKTADSMEQDFQDMLDASEDFHGTSSSMYRNLIESAKKYESSISELSESEQKQLEIILKRGTFLDTESKLYRKLNAALVAKNRETEVATKLEATLLEQSKEQAKVDATRVKSLQAQTTHVDSYAESTRELALSEAEVSLRIAEQQALYEKGFITHQQLLNVKIKLTQAIKTETELTELAGLALDNNTVKTETYVQANEKLFQAYMDGKLTIEELQAAHVKLTTSYSQSAIDAEAAANKTTVLTTAMANLNRDINKVTNDITKYTTALNKDGIVASEVTTITAKLTAAKAKLNDLTTKQTELSEQEALTYPELILLQKKYSDDLELLTARWKAGTISKAEYTAKNEELKKSLSSISEVVGVSTVEIDKNTASTKESTKQTQKQTDALARVNAESVKNAGHAGVSSALTNIWLGLQKELNKELDFTSLTYSELGTELDNVNRELQDFNLATARATHDTIGILKPLDDMTRKIHQRKIAVIEETQALNSWIAKIQAGALNLDQLGKAANQADGYFTHLSDNQLDGLMSAIDEARRKFNALTQDIDGAIDSIEDRLDKATGNFEAIKKREFKREVDALEALIAEARAYGTNTQVQELQQAVRDLKRVQDLEFKSEFDKDITGRRSSTTQQEVDTSFGSKYRSPNVVEIKLTAPSGAVSSVFVEDSQSADNMLNSLSELGQINNEA